MLNAVDEARMTVFAVLAMYGPTSLHATVVTAARSAMGAALDEFEKAVAEAAVAPFKALQADPAEFLTLPQVPHMESTAAELLKDGAFDSSTPPLHLSVFTDSKGEPDATTPPDTYVDALGITHKIPPAVPPPQVFTGTPETKIEADTVRVTGKKARK